MELIANGIAMGAFFWCIFTFLSGFGWYNKLAIRYTKPFGCALCFTFWLCLITNILSENIFETFLIAGVGAITAETIERKLV